MDALEPVVLGTLEVAFDRTHAFTNNDVRLLQQVAEEAAVALAGRRPIANRASGWTAASRS